MEKVKLITFERDYGGGAVYGFPWPQRNYQCTFCPKEFKSAQALGGHMNVHRRDRARLRQSPSLDPNPNFSSTNINSSSFSASSTSSNAVRFVPYPPNLYQHLVVSSRDEERVPLIAHSGRDFVGAPQLGDVKKKLSMGIMGSNVGEVKSLVLQENGGWKKREIVRMGMELELGLKEGLDLELRLGQSNYM